MANALEVTGLKKSFGDQQILRGIDFSVAAGECVSFVGENGAGKSTLAKCLVGVHQPDSGTLTVAGKVVHLGSPREASACGIGLLPQELAYVPELTVFENVVLGRWPGRFGVTRPSAMRRHVEDKIKDFGIELDLDRKMRELSLGDRQMVEISKALVRDAEVLILDEPTAALTDSESNHLIDILLGLKREGLAAIYISHRMDEIGRFSDTVHVLRNGQIALTTTPQESTREQIVTAMLGQAPETLVPLTVGAPRPVAMTVRGLSADGAAPISDISFELRKGEVLGLYGVRGSGTDTLAEALGGLRPDAEGQIEIDGESGKVFKDPRRSQATGISYVPAERKRNGLVLGMSIRDNIVLPVGQKIARKFGILARRDEQRIAEDLAKRTDIRFASLAQPVSQLSGGNQQKALLASRLAPEPAIVVLHEPSRGVDVGARLQIHNYLRQLAEEGLACLLATSDVEEVIAISDRVLVIRDGKIVGELSGSTSTQAQAVLLATGAPS